MMLKFPYCVHTGKVKKVRDSICNYVLSQFLSKIYFQIKTTNQTCLIIRAFDYLQYNAQLNFVYWGKVKQVKESIFD